MILKILTEAKLKTYPEIVTQLKAKDPYFAKLIDVTINDIIRTYLQDVKIDGDIDADDIIDWFYDGVDTWDFIYHYGQDLTTFSIYNLIKADPELTKYITDYAIATKLIDENGKDLMDPYSDKNMSLQDIVSWIFRWNVTNPVYTVDDMERLVAKTLKDNPEMKKPEAMDKIYNSPSYGSKEEINPSMLEEVLDDVNFFILNGDLRHLTKQQLKDLKAKQEEDRLKILKPLNIKEAVEDPSDAQEVKLDKVYQDANKVEEAALAELSKIKPGAAGYNEAAEKYQKLHKATMDALKALDQYRQSRKDAPVEADKAEAEKKEEPAKEEPKQDTDGKLVLNAQVDTINKLGKAAYEKLKAAGYNFNVGAGLRKYPTGVVVAVPNSQKAKLDDIIAKCKEGFKMQNCDPDKVEQIAEPNGVYVAFDNFKEAEVLAVKEDLTEDEISVDEIPAEEEVTIEEPVKEVKPEIEETAFSQMILDAIQREWDLISNINSIIATFDYDYKQENKEDIIKVLNGILDDSTINVGMLHKVNELISQETTDLISAGTEKAEEIINQ